MTNIDKQQLFFFTEHGANWKTQSLQYRGNSLQGFFSLKLKSTAQGKIPIGIFCSNSKSPAQGKISGFFHSKSKFPVQGKKFFRSNPKSPVQGKSLYCRVSQSARFCRIGNQIPLTFSKKSILFMKKHKIQNHLLQSILDIWMLFEDI